MTRLESDPSPTGGRHPARDRGGSRIRFNLGDPYLLQQRKTPRNVLPEFLATAEREQAHLEISHVATARVTAFQGGRSPSEADGRPDPSPLEDCACIGTDAVDLGLQQAFALARAAAGVQRTGRTGSRPRPGCVPAVRRRACSGLLRLRRPGNGARRPDPRWTTTSRQRRSRPRRRQGSRRGAADAAAVAGPQV